MGNVRRREPERLEGAEPDKECRPSPAESPPIESDGPVSSVADVPDDEEDEASVHVTWLDVPTPVGHMDEIEAWRPRRGAWSLALERLALAAERPINRLASPQYNPLYHTGTIAFFLLLVIGLTGVYLFMFFHYGYDASYAAVARMESQFIARTIRAIHRYASGAAVLVTLLHAYRTLFLEKFRGPRWLAWLTGVVLTVILWAAGVTGYWLIWDERALLITDAFRGALEALTPWNPRFMVFLSEAGAAGRSWVLFLLILAAHVVLFLIAIGFFYLHIRRLSRPKWLPPTHWVIGSSVVLLLAALLVPAGMLAQADLSRLPAAIRFDPIFLFFLALPGARWLWWGLLVATVLLAALPWLSRRARRPRPATAAATTAYPPAHPDAPRVRILKDRCTGCTLCALDCPYGAIEMVERDDGKPHKYIALEHVDRCVSCGICVGSCDVMAVSLGAVLPENLWGLVAAGMVDRRRTTDHGQSASVAGGLWSGDRHPHVAMAGAGAVAIDAMRVAGARVVFTCERHAAHGAKPYLLGQKEPVEGPSVFITLPCIGAAPPDLLSRTLDAGALSVRVIGCPPDDCANREGNLWTEQRLTRQRVPRLRRAYAGAALTADWLPPDDFAAAFDRPAHPAATECDPVDRRRMFRDFSWRNFIPAVVLLAVALAVQIALTNLPLRVHAARPAVVQLVSGDIGATFGRLTAAQVSDSEYRLQVLVDSDEVLAQTLPAATLVGEAVEERAAFFHELTLPPGEHRLLMRLTGVHSGTEHIIFDGPISVRAGEVIQPSLVIDAPVACHAPSIRAAGEACPQ